MWMRPVVAVLDGAIAGFVGSAVQNLFFRATSKVAPETPKHVFTPPEREQKDETSTQTVARRVYEDLAQQGSLEEKERAGSIVHFAFGAAWGVVYGLVRGSLPRRSGPLFAAVFATTVWAVSDNLILPAFKLSAWPQKYPARVHGYAWSAHLAYGAALWGTFEALAWGVPRAFALGTTALAMRRTTGLRRVPALARRTARRAVGVVSRATA